MAKKARQQKSNHTANQIDGSAHDATPPQPDGDPITRLTLGEIAIRLGRCSRALDFVSRKSSEPEHLERDINQQVAGATQLMIEVFRRLPTRFGHPSKFELYFGQLGTSGEEELVWAWRYIVSEWIRRKSFTLIGTGEREHIPTKPAPWTPAQQAKWDAIAPYLRQLKEGAIDAKGYDQAMRQVDIDHPVSLKRGEIYIATREFPKPVSQFNKKDRLSHLQRIGRDCAETCRAAAEFVRSEAKAMAIAHSAETTTQAGVISDLPAHEGGDTQWSSENSPKHWAKVFGVSVDTIKRRFRDQRIRNRQNSTKGYQVDLSSIPADKLAAQRPSAN
jgi:hypothetical protein